jgi:hypothetical protein
MDLVELLEELDGYRAMNLIDSLVQDDVVLEDDGLKKVRGAILRIHVQDKTYTDVPPPRQLEEGEVAAYRTDLPSLYNGNIVTEDPNNLADPLGIGLPPLG